MEKNEFQHTDKDWLLYKLENKLLREGLVPKLPGWITTRMLTLTSFVLSPLIILFYYLSTKNKIFLFASSFIVMIEYVADVLDGEVGRYRKRGLFKWGYYMDKFSDFIFLESIFLGLYLFVFPNSIYLILVMIVLFPFYVNSYLKHTIFREYTVSIGKFSPGEMRILLIILNTMIYFDLRHIIKNYIFPIILIVGTIQVIIEVFKTQKKIFNE